MRTIDRLLAISALLLSIVSCEAKVKRYTVDVVKEYPHMRDAYTQGLFFHNGKLYESNGQYGQSSFRIHDMESGKATQSFNFNKKYFVEGSVILGDKLYILTWQSKVAFVYNAKTLEYESSWSYPREGWGLTTDGKSLIASDGSSRLFYMDEKFNLKKTVNVKMEGRPIRYLNELEYIDGKIWANVYTTDIILIIDPESGNVEASIDCSGLLPDKLRDKTTDVLNGIARNPADGKIYLTGKNWPRMYEVKLKEVK